MKKSQPHKNKGVGGVVLAGRVMCSRFLSMPRKHLAMHLYSYIPVMESCLTISRSLSLCLQFCSAKDH